MDACCERIVNLLREDGQSTPRSLVKLVERSGLARSSVMTHLRHLEAQSLVVKEEILQGSVGRPKMLYKPTPMLIKNAQTELRRPEGRRVVIRTLRV